MAKCNYLIIFKIYNNCIFSPFSVASDRRQNIKIGFERKSIVSVTYHVCAILLLAILILLLLIYHLIMHHTCRFYSVEPLSVLVVCVTWEWATTAVIGLQSLLACSGKCLRWIDTNWVLQRSLGRAILMVGPSNRAAFGPKSIDAVSDGGLSRVLKGVVLRQSWVCEWILLRIWVLHIVSLAHHHLPGITQSTSAVSWIWSHCNSSRTGTSWCLVCR